MAYLHPDTWLFSEFNGSAGKYVMVSLLSITYFYAFDVL